MLAWVSPALFWMKQRPAKPGEQAQEEAQRTYQFQKWTVKPGRRTACGETTLRDEDERMGHPA
jgi:protein involved in temperature-dependent protein secretion